MCYSKKPSKRDHQFTSKFHFYSQQQQHTTTFHHQHSFLSFFSLERVANLLLYNKPSAIFLQFLHSGGEDQSFEAKFLSKLQMHNPFCLLHQEKKKSPSTEEPKKLKRGKPPCKLCSSLSKIIVKQQQHHQSRQTLLSPIPALLLNRKDPLSCWVPTQFTKELWCAIFLNLCSICHTACTPKSTDLFSSNPATTVSYSFCTTTH